MAFRTRKLVPGGKEFDQKKYSPCDSCYMSPPPPPLYQPEVDNKQAGTSMILIIMLCILGVVLFFLSYFTIIRFRSSLRRAGARRRNAAVTETGQDFIDENQGPVMIDHPIWHIRTVGLPQSIIESISGFRYVKGDGLIEESDCSICLSEFQQDERLRLLPKCSHAFHALCVDKWLRSHTNCPVCRAPILITTASVTTSVSPEQNRAVNQQPSVPETEPDQNAEPSGASVNRISTDQNLRVFSDLSHRNRTAAFEKQPPVRRCSSMDNFRRSDVELGVKKEEGSSSSKIEKTNSGFYGLIKSSSNGRRSSKKTSFLDQDNLQCI